MSEGGLERSSPSPEMSEVEELRNLPVGRSVGKSRPVSLPGFPAELTLVPVRSRFAAGSDPLVTAFPATHASVTRPSVGQNQKLDRENAVGQNTY